MEKEQCAILVTVVILIAIVTIAFIHTMVVNGLTSKVLPRLLVDGPPVNFTRNGTNLEVEIAQQAIESNDD